MARQLGQSISGPIPLHSSSEVQPQFEGITVFQHLFNLGRIRTIQVYSQQGRLYVLFQECLLKADSCSVAAEPEPCLVALESKAAAFESLQALNDVQHDESWQCILEFAVDLPLPPSLNPILSPRRNPSLAMLPVLELELAFVEAVIERGAAFRASQEQLSWQPQSPRFNTNETPSVNYPTSLNCTVVPGSNGLLSQMFEGLTEGVDAAGFQHLPEEGPGSDPIAYNKTEEISHWKKGSSQEDGAFLPFPSLSTFPVGNSQSLQPQSTSPATTSMQTVGRLAQPAGAGTKGTWQPANSVCKLPPLLPRPGLRTPRKVDPIAIPSASASCPSQSFLHGSPVSVDRVQPSRYKRSAPTLPDVAAYPYRTIGPTELSLGSVPSSWSTSTSSISSSPALSPVSTLEHQLQWQLDTGGSSPQPCVTSQPANQSTKPVIIPSRPTPQTLGGHDDWEANLRAALAALEASEPPLSFGEQGRFSECALVAPDSMNEDFTSNLGIPAAALRGNSNRSAEEWSLGVPGTSTGVFSAHVLNASGLDSKPSPGDLLWRPSEELGEWRSGSRIPSSPPKEVEKLSSMPLASLVPYFEMPIKVAAKNLGVGQTLLKHRCRQLGVARWPYRKVRSLRGLIQTIQDMGVDDGSEKVATAIQHLQSEREKIASAPSEAICEKTKKLRQACFKATHKIRNQLTTLTRTAPASQDCSPETKSLTRSVAFPRSVSEPLCDIDFFGE